MDLGETRRALDELVALERRGHACQPAMIAAAAARQA